MRAGVIVMISNFPPVQESGRFVLHITILLSVGGTLPPLEVKQAETAVLYKAMVLQEVRYHQKEIALL